MKKNKEKRKWRDVLETTNRETIEVAIWNHKKQGWAYIEPWEPLDGNESTRTFTNGNQEHLLQSRPMEDIKCLVSESYG